jgi:cobyrinic acid a,c-diamide synthase
MVHRRVIGVPGGNLDMFFSTGEEIAASVCRGGGEAAVLEGVMGIYDGIAGTGGEGSCYDVANVTDTAVILVIDVKGMGQTMLSVIKGILLDDNNGIIGGVVLNRISPHYYESISPSVVKLLSDLSANRGREVKLLGGIPDTKGIHLESRHLGLKMPGEMDDLREQVEHAADLIEEYLDMDALTAIMDAAEELPDDCRHKPVSSTSGLTLAVARDEAFCFYYEENLRSLKELGITITEFSPLHDSAVPADADGLLLGGGYPELYADKLSYNSSMTESVSKAIKAGMPSLAECGGFMYLMDALKDKDGQSYPMAGVIRGESFYTGKLSRFGYLELKGKKRDTILDGLTVRGHEFHYYDSTSNGGDASAVKPGSGRTWDCIHAGSDHIWGYPHLWYPSCPELLNRFRTAMECYRKNRNNE